MDIFLIIMNYYAPEQKEKVRSAVIALVPFEKMRLSEFEENIAQLKLFDSYEELAIRNKILSYELYINAEKLGCFCLTNSNQQYFK